MSIEIQAAIMDMIMTLMSYGRDGKLGGTELDKDITNWIEETTQRQ